MSEVSPWARLGGIIEEDEGGKISETNSEVTHLRKQVTELSEMLAALEDRVRVLEEGSVEPIENAFTVLSREELGIETPTITEDELAVAMENDKVVVIESGFTAPTMEELREKRDRKKPGVEPTGTSTDSFSESVPEEKDFGDMAYLMADLIWEHIVSEGAILNNQVKRQILSPKGIEVTKADRAELKRLIETGETKFDFERLDNFRVLYYIGDDPYGEYQKTYGESSK